jgi:hypothetical protein
LQLRAGSLRGRERAKDVLAEQGDGIDGVEAYLQEFGKSFEDVFADWAAANWLDADDGPYAHPGVEARTQISRRLSAGDGNSVVGQFGTDYLKASGSGVFTFNGADEVGLGVDGGDGGYWWSNRGDGIDTKLTREIDLRGVPEATLRFRTWYDIERGLGLCIRRSRRTAGRPGRLIPVRSRATTTRLKRRMGPDTRDRVPGGCRNWSTSAYARRRYFCALNT